MTHPNAFAAAVMTGLAALIVKIAQHYGYANMTDEQAVAVAGGSVTAILFLGRRFWQLGLSGILRGLWRGSQKQGAKGSAPEPAAAGELKTEEASP